MIRGIRRCLWMIGDVCLRWRLVLLLTAGLFAACGDKPVSDDSFEDLTDIGRIDELQEMFNQDLGAPRLILLLSPT